MDKIIEAFKDFDFGVAFSSLSGEQIIMALLGFIISIFAGFFFGGAIFYALGVKSGKKAAKKKKKTEFTSADNAYQKIEQANLDSLLDSLVTAGADDIFSDDLELIEDDVIEETPTATKEETAEEDAEKAKSLGIVNELEDEEFKAMIETRRKNLPIFTRDEILMYVETLKNYGGRAVVERRNKTMNYDRAKVGGNTFMVMYERKSTPIMLVRLHLNTVNKLIEQMGDCVVPAPALGPDWYSVVFKAMANSAVLMLTTVKLAYKYTFSQEFFKNTEGKIVTDPKTVELNERELNYSLSVYDYTCHERAMAVSDTLDDEYHINYFSKSEICEYATDELNTILPTVINWRTANKPATLKTGDKMYSIIYERAGVVKLIFRADEEYIELQKTLHDNICESTFPVSRDWMWYSVVIDPKDFSEKQIKELLRYSYEYVIKIHKLNEEVASESEGK